MALTALDTKTALIVVDLQEGIVSFPTVHPIYDVVRHASALATAFRQRGLPVVLVNVDGAAPGRTALGRKPGKRPVGWTDIVPELNPQRSDHVITKKTWGAFTNTNLEAYLKRRRVTQVVIVGVATSIGVESTARQAHELGLNVTLAVDAMTDTNLDAHTNSVARIFPRLGETGTAREIIGLLDAKGAVP